MMHALLSNALVVNGSIGLIILILGIFLSRGKIATWALVTVKFLDKKIGNKATAFLVSKLHEFADDMQEDIKQDSQETGK
jgi:hypothetical protein